MQTTQQKPSFNIIGGMGALTGAKFFSVLYKLATTHFGATKDSQYPNATVVSSNDLPGKNDTLEILLRLKNGEKPSEYDMQKVCSLVKEIILLEEGSPHIKDSYTLYPCNTIHALLDPEIDALLPREASLLRNMKHPVISIIKATVEYANNTHNKEGKIQKVGILATPVTVKSKLYDDFNRYGIETVYPDEEYQDIVYKVIYDIKAGQHKTAEGKAKIVEQLTAVSNHLKDKGAQALVGGCTEIPLSFTDKNYQKLPIISSIDTLATAALDIYANGTNSAYYKMCVMHPCHEHTIDIDRLIVHNSGTHTNNCNDLQTLGLCSDRPQERSTTQHQPPVNQRQIAR